MSKYNHNTEDLEKATGLSIKVVVNKAFALYNGISIKDACISKHTEVVEKGMSKQELAFMVAILTQELIEARPTVIPDTLKNLLEDQNLNADMCTCPKCIARRARTAVLFEASDLDIDTKLTGEGGNS